MMMSENKRFNYVLGEGFTDYMMQLTETEVCDLLNNQEDLINELYHTIRVQKKIIKTLQEQVRIQDQIIDLVE